MAESEPWLRGPISNIPPHVMPAFFSFQQVREDLSTHTPAINKAQLWQEMAGKHSLGYHLKHLAGSVDRLTTYLVGGHLSPEQLDFLRNEHTPGDELSHLLAKLNRSFEAAELQLLQIKQESLFEPRAVGRQLLPTTVIGLIVHLCEHTQRHLGQAVLLTKLLRQN